MNTPAAEVEITAALVERLVESQHPDLAGPLVHIGNGWDNALYRLGDDLCVRLPRRQVAVDLIVNEQRWLPLLADRVDIPVPVPIRIGTPTDGFAWPWSVSPWYDGISVAEVEQSKRTVIARDLADFMVDLHLPAPADAPRNPVRGVPLEARAGAFRDRLDQLAQLKRSEEVPTGEAIPAVEELRARWETAIATPKWSGPPLWLHGDPHPANILMTHDQTALRAMLDFGDLTSGDPASDLAAAWLVFDRTGRETFRARVDERGGVDPDTWERARGWALMVGAAIAAGSGDNPVMAKVGAQALVQVCVDPGSVR